jgi:hypothetical protein
MEKKPFDERAHVPTIPIHRLVIRAMHHGGIGSAGCAFYAGLAFCSGRTDAVMAPGEILV